MGSSFGRAGLRSLPPRAHRKQLLQNRAAGLCQSGLGASRSLMPVLLALSMASGSAFIALNVPRSTVPKSGLPAWARPDGTVRSVSVCGAVGMGGGWWAGRTGCKWDRAQMLVADSTPRGVGLDLPHTMHRFVTRPKPRDCHYDGSTRQIRYGTSPRHIQGHYRDRVVHIGSHFGDMYYCSTGGCNE